MNPSPIRDRAGLTLIELMVTLVIVGMIITATMMLVNQQAQAFALGTGRTAAAQNYRFALNTLERELRAIGTGVHTRQPHLVYAAENVVIFNADLVSNDVTDHASVYFDPDAPPGSVEALTRSNRVIIPFTAIQYPDSSYLDNGTNTGAETLTFFFAADSTTNEPNRFVLYRRVNALAPTVVARNLSRTDGQPFFEFYLPVPPTENSPSRLAAIPVNALPMRHVAPIHGSAADTAQSARIDSISAIRINFTSSSTAGGAHQSRSVSRLVRLPNVGVIRRVTCGDSPHSPGGVTRSLVGTAVLLTWAPSADEFGGERDVLRYLIWRRTGSAAWGDAIASVPAGLASYTHLDNTVLPGTQYQYAVAAQDCSPALSDLRVSTTITVP